MELYTWVSYSTYKNFYIPTKQLTYFFSSNVEVLVDLFRWCGHFQYCSRWWPWIVGSLSLVRSGIHVLEPVGPRIRKILTFQYHTGLKTTTSRTEIINRCVDPWVRSTMMRSTLIHHVTSILLLFNLDGLWKVTGHSWWTIFWFLFCFLVGFGWVA